MRIQTERLVLRDFTELRQELVTTGGRFDSHLLQEVPYYQLTLCCMGNAGTAMCSPDLVIKERQSRRDRFLSMDPADLKESENYLKIEQMYGDVLDALTQRIAPSWDELSSGQKVWCRLTCLYNHLENPEPRIQLTLDAFRHCAESPNGYIPKDVCRVYANKLRGMVPGKFSDEIFRSKIREMANTLLDFMSGEERKVVEKEQLRDFSCTSDCFRVLG